MVIFAHIFSKKALKSLFLLQRFQRFLGNSFKKGQVATLKQTTPQPQSPIFVLINFLKQLWRLNFEF